jgi:hypothetical protein
MWCAGAGSPCGARVPRTDGVDDTILLTYLERAALVELGLRPTFVLRQNTGAQVTTDFVRASTEVWAHAAEITIAGQTGLMPLELGPQVAALMAEAIPEAVGDLRLIREHRARWRAGDASHGIPGLGNAATEGCFADSIDRDTRLLEGLRSLDRRLQG